MLTFGSLFAGIGGFDLGFERVGMQCKWQVEIDDYATRVLEKHWPDVARFRDIKECGGHNLEQVDIICGGDPCQGNSIAGAINKRKVDDIGANFPRVVAALRPLCVVRENAGIERSDAVRSWKRMRADFESLGYSVVPVRVSTAMVGGDHWRARTFLVGFSSDACCERWEGVDWEGLETRDACRVGGDELRPEPPAKDVRSAPRICGVAHGVPNRLDRIRCLGNAVDPRVAEWIGRRIVEAFDNGGAA